MFFLLARNIRIIISENIKNLPNSLEKIALISIFASVLLSLIFLGDKMFSNF